MDCGELVCDPHGEHNQKDEAGEVDGSTAPETGDAADVDHCNVNQPHGECEKYLGVAEVRNADGGLGDEGSDEKAGGHAGEAEEKSFEGDLIGGFERRQP